MNDVQSEVQNLNNSRLTDSSILLIINQINGIRNPKTITKYKVK
jgi:hypothetical protein